MARTRDLRIPLPASADMEAGPCTPTYEFPVSLPYPRPMPDRRDVSASSRSLTRSPTPSVTGKRIREDDEWAPAEVEVLQNVLSRPPKEALFAPGSMPPPHILDELTSAVVGQFGAVNLQAEDDAQSSTRTQSTSTFGDLLAVPSVITPLSVIDDPMDGYYASTEHSPNPSVCGSRVPSPIPTARWQHSWEETRRMLTTLALADTRLGRERADRYLTRQERLARPGVRRVDSMDFLDDNKSDSQPSERLGRVLRLSTKLQNSARETPALTRAASCGAPAGSQGPAGPSIGSVSTPPVCFTRPFGALSLTSPNVRPAPMRRNSSARSDRSLSSRRPSLLAIGRNFTAEDLDAELEEELRQSASAPRGNVTSIEDVSPKTPISSLPPHGGALGLEATPPHALSVSDDTSPRRRASAPDILSPRLVRSASYSAVTKREPRPEPRGNSHDYGKRRPLGLGLGLPPAPVHAPTVLGAAFTEVQKPRNELWDSDSDRSCDNVVSVKRRSRRPHLAMTAMVASAGAASAASGSQPMQRPKLIIDENPDTSPVLASPFEERDMPLA